MESGVEISDKQMHVSSFKMAEFVCELIENPLSSRFVVSIVRNVNVEDIEFEIVLNLQGSDEDVTINLLIVEEVVLKVFFTDGGNSPVFFVVIGVLRVCAFLFFTFPFASIALPFGDCFAFALGCGLFEIHLLVALMKT